jgi:hypothetical protein
MSSTPRPPFRLPSRLAALAERPVAPPEQPASPIDAAAPEEGFGALLPRPARGLLLVLAYGLATILMTWPWVTRLGNSVPPGGDPLLQVWISRWVQHALATGPPHLYDANAFFPLHTTLAYSDSNIPAGIMAAPIYLLAGNAILANNLLVLGTFVLAACGTYLLVRELVGNRAAAFLAGFAYAFLPYRFAHIWHLNQLGHAWTPLVLFVLLLFIRRQRWPYAVAFGVLVAVQVLTSFYVAFQIAFAVAVLLAVALVADPRARAPRFLLQLAAAVALAAVIILPLALPYLQVRDQQGLERTLFEAESYRASFTSYLKVQNGNHLWSWLMERHGGEDTLFPGAVVLAGAVLGLLGFRRRPAITAGALLLLAIGFVLSLGPTWHPEANGGVPLPYRLLYEHFPFFKAMRVPARFGVLALLALVLLAACGAARVWERYADRLPAARRLASGAGLTGLLAVLILAELYTAPLHFVRVDNSPEITAAYRWLAEQPGRDPVIEFPALTDDAAAAAQMYRSTLHWKPVVNGYSGFAPRAHDEYMRAFSGDLKRADGSVAENISYVNADNVGLIQRLGVRYLLLHHYGYKREDWPLVVAQLEGTGAVRKVGDFGEAAIYTVNEPTAPLPTVAVDFYAPTGVVRGAFWEPTFVARNPSPHKTLFFIDRPLTLTTTWRDTNGTVVRRDEQAVAIPGVVPSGELFCSVRACPTVPGATLPPPDASSPRLYPDTPGQYSVEMALTGGIARSRTIAVTVTDTATPAQAGGAPLALSNATFASKTVAPGAALDMVLTWTARRPAPEDYTLFAQLVGPDGKVWGQYDALAGWTGHYTSQWAAGERVELPWSVPLKAAAPPGQYRLLVGMYRHTGGGVERVILAYPTGDATEGWVTEVTVP